MTREKAVNEYVIPALKNTWNEKVCAEVINALWQEPRWIPVSERLPKAGEYIGNVDRYYLVQNEYGDMLVARYTHSEYWEQIYQFKPLGDEIVAWMPLPKPYKAESEDEKSYTPEEVQNILIKEGQEHGSDYGIEWGDIIKFSPSEVGRILKAESEEA